nr:AarF/UbiB family protein [Microbacterium lemovicicum]
MITDVLTVVLALLSALLVGFVARRTLATPVGWPRSIIVGLLVFLTGPAFANWVVDEAAILPASGETGDARIAFVAIGLVIIALAWIFALGVAILVGLEAIFPTRPLSNPITVIRAASRRAKRSRRYLQIVGIASRHGIGWMFSGSNRAAHELTTSQQRAQALVRAINASGVSFVKLGQVLSTRRDMIPEPYISALGSLQSSATTLEWAEIREVIRAEVPGDVDAVFASIDEVPLAAASVAQVHTATLIDGTPVVVKVQRPTARAQVTADVDIILRLAERAETRTRIGRNLRLQSVARGFTTSLLDELDYRIEATNTEMIRRSLAKISSDHESIGISVPRLFPAASSARLLTMELVDGVPLSRAADRLDALPKERRTALAARLMGAVVEQMLVHGVFHADLHPGNAILREDGTLGLIDFGAVGILEHSQRQRLTALLLAAASEDDVAATDALLLIVDAPSDLDVDAFRHDIGVVITSEQYRPSGSGSIFTRMVDVIRENRIGLPGDLAAAFRSLATLEGCLKVIDPDFDMMRQALLLVPKLLRRVQSLPRAATSAQARAAVLAEMVGTLPHRADAVLSGIENGTLAIRVKSLDGPERAFLTSTTSLVVGTVVSIAAVVVAVVLIVSDTGPMLVGQVGMFDLLGAVIGFFGFLGLLRAVRQTFVGPRG